jgi:hypothetical protein
VNRDLDEAKRFLFVRISLRNVDCYRLQFANATKVSRVRVEPVK